MKRLVVRADSSLIMQAIATGLRKSGEFELLGHVNGRTGSVHAIVEAAPDVVLLDDIDQSGQAIAMLNQIRALAAQVAVVVITMSMEPDWSGSRRLPMGDRANGGRPFNLGAGGLAWRRRHRSADRKSGRPRVRCGTRLSRHENGGLPASVW